MTHVMLDLETLGKDPGCIILSIGAVSFEPKGEGHKYEFSRNICPIVSEVLGFRKDPETVKWWTEQNPEAWKALETDRVDIYSAIAEFKDWFNSVNGKQIWCQGANFDEPILRRAFTILNVEAPWKFYDVRDTRTVYDIFNFNPKTITRKGTYHCALDDAAHQVKCVQNALHS